MNSSLLTLLKARTLTNAFRDQRRAESYRHHDSERDFAREARDRYYLAQSTAQRMI